MACLYCTFLPSFVCVYMFSGMHTHVKAKVDIGVLITFRPTFLVRVSHWTWGLLMGFSYVPMHRHSYNYRHMPTCATCYMSVWDQIQVLTLLHQVLSKPFPYICATFSYRSKCRAKNTVRNGMNLPTISIMRKSCESFRLIVLRVSVLFCLSFFGVE